MAVLRWLDGDELASARVEAAMPYCPVMSWMNLGEVAYIVERRAGADRARRVVRGFRHASRWTCQPKLAYSKRLTIRRRTQWRT